MAWCFIDEANKYAEWPLEVGNVVLTAERRKRLTESDSIRFLNLIYDLPITVQQETPDRMLKEIFALARECYISSYDASYLDLAMRNGVPIATQDTGLKKAAKRCNVPSFNGQQR